MFNIKIEKNLREINLDADPYRVDFDEGLDNIVSLLHEICSYLQDQGDVAFKIDGFGGKIFLYLRTDLCIFLEELPELRSWLNSDMSSTYVLVFFEQGNEFNLDFSYSNKIKIVLDAWRDEITPDDTEIISYGELDKQLDSLITTFVELGRLRCPEIYQHPWFKEWVTSVSR